MYEKRLREIEARRAEIRKLVETASDEELAKHAPWAGELCARHVFTAENVDAILRDEVGRVFARVLEHAGVFKCGAEGREAFLRFTASV